jgi:hypothetical protein
MAEFLWNWMRAVLALVTAGVLAVAGGRVMVHGLLVWWWRWSLTAFELRLPHTATVDEVSRWIGTLRAILRARPWWSLLPRWPICLETTATDHGIRQVLVVPRRLHAETRSALAAVLPGARLSELAGYLATEQPIRFRFAGEAGLKSTGELLAVDRGEDTSRHLLAALQPLESGELVRVQWLLAGALGPRWAVDPRTDRATLPPYLKHPDPLLVAVCRVAVCSQLGRCHARALYRGVWAALRGMNTPPARITRRWVLPSVVVAARVVLRTVPRGRWPMVMTSREVGGLLGLVAGDTSLPGVPGGVSRTLPPPPSMPATGLVVAVSNYPGMRAPLCLSASDRLRHLWVLGPTGVGKSTLLANLISYDIHRGDALIVIDAGGDLVSDVLARIPAARHEDVIVVDPTSTDRMTGFNPLYSRRSEENELTASLVFHVLHSMYASSWGPRTADILRASLLTLTMTRAPNGQRFTICDLVELLTNTGFRRFVTAQAAQPLTPTLESFWRRWYGALSDTQRLQMISPALNKLRVFNLYSPLRLTLGQSVGIDFVEAMQKKRIVLVPLKTGLLGAETAAVVGSLVLASVWQATLARAALPKDQRHPVWMYLDEFQRLVRLPIDLADMLAQARGFGLGLTLAHQHLGQLSPEVKAAVLSTTRSQLIFQIEAHDATELAPRFTPLTRDDLTALGPHEIALRPCVGGSTLPPVTGTTYPLPDPMTDPTALAHASRYRYGLPLAEIEQQITDRTTVTPTLDKRSNRIPTGAPR